MKRSIVWLVVIVGLAGCAPSLAEVRQRSPGRTGRVIGVEYQSLAGCVAEGLQTAHRSWVVVDLGNLTYQTITRPDAKRAMVTGSMPSPTPATPIIDLTFRQEGADVVIENRWGGIGLGHGERFDPRVWPIIDGCGRVVDITPPLPK